MESVQVPEIAEVKKKTPKKQIMASVRAGIIFPVARFRKTLVRYAPRVSKTACVFSAAVCEYLIAETLKISVDESKKRAKRSKHPRIFDQDIKNAWTNDTDFAPIVQDTIFAHTGVPAIEQIESRIDERIQKKARKQKRKKLHSKKTKTNKESTAPTAN